MATSLKGWPEAAARTVVRELMATGKWSYRHIYLGIRHGFSCEYCGRDLFGSVDDYKQWQQDHIVPGGGDEVDDLVLACLLCNTKYKGRRRPAGDTREARIEDTRRWIEEVRERTKGDLDTFRSIIQKVQKP